MKFSSSKTVPIIFARGKYDKPPNIILNGVPMEYDNVVKYLGVYIDSQLLWTEHIKIKIKKAKKLLMNIARVCHPTWGISPWAAAYYWKCCILPMFTYGCLVWHRVCRNKTVQDDLKRFQRLALKPIVPQGAVKMLAGKALGTLKFNYFLYKSSIFQSKICFFSPKNNVGVF